MVKWLTRLSNLLRIGRLGREIDEEVRFHVDMRAAEFQKAGLSPEDARREALKRFGGSPLLVRERVRDARFLTWLDSVRQDLLLGARLVRRSPGLAAAALLSLGLGVGATVGVFAVGDALALRPLPVNRPGDLLVAQWHSTEWPDVGEWGTNDDDNNMFSFSYPTYQRLAATPGIDLAGFQNLDGAVLSIRGRASSGDGTIATGSFFRVLDVRPALGRLFVDADNLATSPPVVVISHRLWQSAFGGDAGVVGQSVRVNGRSFTVVGVAPKDFFGMMPGKWSDFYVPTCWLPTLKPEFVAEAPLSSEKFWWVQIVGRPRPGSSLHAVQAEMATKFDGTVKPLITKPKQNARFSLRRGTQGFAFTESTSYAPIAILMALVSLVLLIACSNVANLLLARGAARSRESAMRLALGAGRLRLVRQHLTESLVLAGLSGVVGFVFAGWFAQTIVSMAPGNDALVVDLGFSWRVAGFSAALTVVAGLLVGIPPAIGLSRASVSQALRSGVTVRAGWRRHRVGVARPLVAVQIALSLLVLVMAGLFVRTLGNLKEVAVGFNPDHVMLFTLDPTAAGYSDAQKVSATHRIASRLAAVPDVRGVTWSTFSLLQGISWNTLVQLEGDPTPKRPPCNLLTVGPGFHRLMKVPLVAGRLFEERDGDGAPKVAVVDESFSRQYLGGRSPLGTRFSAEFNRGKVQVEIVGVVRNALYAGFRRPVRPVAYLPDAQVPLPMGPTFALKVAGDGSSVAAAIGRVVHELEPDLPVTRVRTYDEQIGRQLAVERSLSVMASAFGAVALLLAAIGLYGVMAFAVTRRTAELGVRLALGASRREVLRLVLVDSARVILPGACVGLAAAIGTTRLVEAQLYGLKPTDPVTLAAAVLLIVAVGATAAFIPARRAATIDPVDALRCE
jgi:predicted permease